MLSCSVAGSASCHFMQIVVSVKRIRREFGAVCTFSDRNVDKVKDGIIDCPPYEEKSFDLKRMELDRGVQVVKLYDEFCSSSRYHVIMKMIIMDTAIISKRLLPSDHITFGYLLSQIYLSSSVSLLKFL